jgi:light-regulated signal transduction histidine kinase (bacteriophytochrome)
VSEEPNSTTEESVSPPAFGAGLREGLPQGYRMRADRHYVDQLSSPAAGQPVRMIPVGQIAVAEAAPASDLRPLIESIRIHGVVHPLLVRRNRSQYLVIAGRKRLAAAQTLRLETVPCLVHDVSETEAAALAAADNMAAGRAQQPDGSAPLASATLRVLAEHFKTIRTFADLLPPSLSALDRSSVDLIRAHAWRAARMLDAVDMVAGTPFALRERAVSTVLDELIDGFAAESRMAGVVIRADVSSERASARVNAPELIAGLSGALLATLPLVEQASHPVISILVSATDEAGLVAEVSQFSHAIAPSLAERFFDGDARDRPGGHVAAVGALAVRALAERHAGKATFEGTDRGSRLSITLRTK